MNDRQLLEQLDRRAADATADLRTRAQARPRPDFDADAPQVLTLDRVADTTRRRPTRLLAVAAVIGLLAAAVAVGVVVNRRSSPSDQRPAGDPDSTEVKSVAPRPYVATNLPKGFKVAGAAESPPDEESSSDQGPFSTPTPGVQLYTLFGPSDDDPRLAVTIGPPITPSRSNETFKVGSRTLIAIDDPRAGGQRVALPRTDEALLLVAPTLDRQTLGRLALRTRVAGSPPTLLVKDLPKDWKRLGSFLQEISLSPVAVSGELGPAYRIEYIRPATNDRPVSYRITSRSGDEASVNAYRLFSRRAETIEVRGHPGVLATTPREPGRGGTGRVLTWLERPGEMIEVVATGGSKAEFEKLVEGLRPASDVEFKKAVLLSPKSAFGSEAPLVNTPPGLLEIGTGTFADGTTWTMHVQVQTPDGNPVATIKLGLDGPLTSMFGPRDGSKEILSSGDYEQGGRSFSYGLVGSNVARVALVGDDGHWIEAIPVAGGGYRGWLVEVTDFIDRKPLIVAHDAAGREVEHIPAKRLANYDSPTATVPTTVPQPGN